jgi:hypothetical protein
MTTPRVSAALDELRAALLEELLGTISTTLGSTLGGEGLAPSPGAKRGPGRPRATAPTAAASRPRAKGAKRTQAEIEAQANTVLAFVKKNPGARAEHISKGTGVVSKDLALVITKLLDDKSIGKKGQRRATSYTAK